jgi:site-specific recombinase XerD
VTAMYPVFDKYPEFPEYLEEAATNRTDSACSMDQYIHVLRRFGEFLAGENVAKVHDVNKDTIIAWNKQMQKVGYAAATVAQRISIVKGFFGWMMEMERIEAFPFPEFMRKVGKPPRTPNILMPRMILALRELRFIPVEKSAAIETLFSSGMRVSELCQLRANQIEWNVVPQDLSTNAPSVYCGGRIQLKREETSIKSGRSRITYFSKVSARLLRKHMEKFRIPFDSTQRLFRWRRNNITHWLYELTDKVPMLQESIDQHSKIIDLSQTEEDISQIQDERMRRLARERQKKEQRFIESGITDPRHGKHQRMLKSRRFKLHGLRYAFCCLMYYRNYHGERNNRDRCMRMMGHSNSAIHYQYLFDMDWVTNDAMWEALVAGRKQDWFAPS